MAENTPAPDKPTYTLQYRAPVTAAHARRTAANSASFILPHLRPIMHILDVGCGPGSISCDLAALVPEGSLTGIDISPTVLDQAKALAASRNLTNTTFATGDILAGLPFPDHSFDCIYSSQVLNHLSDPVAALREMKRLCNPGGFVASRCGIMHLWYPTNPQLEKMDQILERTLKHGGALQSGAGTYVHAWAREAGFDPSRVMTGVNGYATCTPAARAELKKFYVDWRQSASSFRKGAVAAGVKEEELEEVVDAICAWAEDEDGWQTMVCGETICRV